MNRFVARFCDNLPVLLLNIGFAVLWYHKMLPQALDTVISLALMSAMFAYFVYMQQRDGQTLGKRFQKIKVCKVNGSPISWREAVVREIPTPAASLLIVLITIISPSSVYLISDLSSTMTVWFVFDVLCAVIRSDNRSLHDLIAGTIVIPVPAVTPIVSEPVA